jgi:hypothetical protein
VPGGEPVDGGVGIGQAHPGDLVDHPVLAEVLHHEDEAALVVHVGVVARRHADGRHGGQLAEEGDLALVHGQHGRREHRRLVEGGQLHDHALRQPTAVQPAPVQRAADADPLTDLLDADGLDHPARHLTEPLGRDVIDRRRNPHAHPPGSSRAQRRARTNSSWLKHHDGAHFSGDRIRPTTVYPCSSTSRMT